MSDIDEIVRLAFDIAALRKKKTLKAKGRVFSDRAHNQWLLSKRVKNNFAELLIPALKYAEELTSQRSGPEFEKFVRIYLLGELLDVTRTRGRPQKEIGIKLRRSIFVE